MRNLISIFFLLLGIGFCGCSKPPTQLVEKNINYFELADQIMEETCEQLCNEYGLRCCADGGNFYLDIQEISLSFNANKILDPDEARKLEIIAIETLIEKINSNEKIRPYLREYPFTPDRANIIVSSSYNAALEDGDLMCVLQAKNALYFNYQDSKVQLKYRDEEEPYEEALKKVSQEFPELLERIRHEKIDS